MSEARSVRARSLIAAVERHPVAAVFAVALVARTLVALVVYWRFGGSLLLDDATYSEMAATKAAGEAGAWAPYVDWLYLRTGVLLVPITGLYALFGPVKLLGQLYVALLGAATAAVTTRLALEAVARRWALAAGLVVALLPSQVLWSSLILKDAGVWLVLSALALVVALAGRADGARLVALGGAAAGLLTLLGFLRLHTLVVAGVALVLTAWVGSRHCRVRRVAVAALLAVSIPWLAFGIGPAGIGIVSTSTSASLGERRAENARQSNTAVVPPAPGAAGTPTPPGDELATSNLAYLPRGLSVILFEPVPWSSGGPVLLDLARGEALLWYPLLALALVGLTSVRRHLRVAAFPLVVGCGIAVMYALVEGNVGTAYRHRGEVVWVVALGCALGLVQLQRLRPRVRRGRFVEPAG